LDNGEIRYLWRFALPLIGVTNIKENG